MKRFLIFTKALLLIHLRAREVLFWNFAFPVFLMLIYGLIMAEYMKWLTPGVIVLNALSFGLVSSSAVLVEMREKGILRRLRATPLPALHLLGAYLSVNLLLGLGQGGLILLVGVAVYGLKLSFVGLALGLPMIVAGALTFLALGQVVGGLAPKAGVATAAGMTLYFGLMFISDMVFPVAQLPAWLQAVVAYFPSYAVVQLVRAPLLEGTLAANWPVNLALMAAYALAATLIAGRLFRWDPRA
ncbi:MAG: ABC transporter permease [Anaerolineales bacterium]|nr:ABC transporter permease [Anaerolineales bacterium]